MDSISVNYLAILVGGILSMVVGSIWYGPLFGKRWMSLIGVSSLGPKEQKKLQKSYAPLYLLQFLLTLFQVLILAHLIADTTRATGLERSLFIWAAFIIPTIAGSVIWTNEPTKKKKERFLIQGGYQLVMFIIFGLLLQLWK